MNEARKLLGFNSFIMEDSYGFLGETDDGVIRRYQVSVGT